MNLLYDCLPGEVSEPDEEPNPLPLLGGCGQALITAAEFLVGRTSADVHLEGCGPCRNGFINLGRRASALEWLCGTDADTETPHAVMPASSAA